MNIYSRAVIVAGSTVSNQLLQANIYPNDLVIGADKGVVSLLDAGIKPQFAIGDFDTAGTHQIDEWQKAGITVLTLPIMKDLTDTQAALEHALTFDIKDILLLGSLGGARVDHALANIGSLEWLSRSGVRGTLQDETNRLSLLVGPGKMKIKRDGFTFLSILPISGKVENITTMGLVYPLVGQQMHRGTTLGISNEIIEEKAIISISSGKCLIIQSKDNQ